MDIRNLRKKLGGRNEYLASLLNQQAKQKVETAQAENAELVFAVATELADYTDEKTKRVVSGNIIYVSKEGDDGNDGNHPDEALKTINAALIKCPVGGIVSVVDRGPYEEDITIGTRVILDAPDTTLM